MLTYRALAAGALSEANAYTAHLLEQTLPDEHMKLAEYYGRTHGVDDCLADGMGAVPTVRPDLDPRLAEAFAVEPGEVLTEARLASILSGRRADKTDLPAKKQAQTTADGRHKISGIDFCLSAPKSVSVAWAFAKTEAERASILQCHRDARDEALRYVEQELGLSRVGHQGEQVKVRSKLAWILIDHYTARATIDITRPDPVTGVVGTELYTLAPNTAGDPQLHSHCIIPNLTITDTGKLVALNTMLLHGRKLEFGAVYQAFLAENLRRIGIEADLDPETLMAHIPTIPKEVCQEFSKRTGDAREAARTAASDRGQDWDTMTAADKIAMLKRGARSTRRAKADDLANFAAWFKQAADIGWSHVSAITRKPRKEPEPDHIDKAAETAMPLLSDLFERRAVLWGSDARLQAVRGLIKWGIRSTKDIGEITRRMVRDGIMQDGRTTRLRWAETERGVKISTELHYEQEQELIALARDAAADRSRALFDADLDAVEIDYRGEAGKQQRAATRKLGKGGAFGVLIGSAGSGKSSRTLRHLAQCYRKRGYTVWGTAQAWRQADALKDCGINGFNLRALQPLLDGLERETTKIAHDHMVIIDEISQVGTLDLLRLLRLRARYGFQVIATGDDRQAQSISAGPVIELLREALGADAIPEILTTVRQQSDRERDIAGMFRDGRIAEAISAKRQDATAELVPGGYAEAVERVAELAVQTGATVCAPTNADAHAIGAAIRKRRGIVGGRTMQAIDNQGNEFELTLATGDRVRLFRRTHALFGNGRDAHIGNNGTVLEVVEIMDHGMKVRAKSGKTAYLSWEKLSDDEGRVRLAYGECLTIDSAQGATSDHHILAMPGGSRGVNGFAAYVGMSRHRVKSWIIGSEGAEMRDVDTSRPLGVREAITPDAMWANVVKNLSRRDLKETATAFQRRVEDLRKKTTRDFQATMRAKETGPDGFRLRQAAKAYTTRPSAAPPLRTTFQAHGLGR